MVKITPKEFGQTIRKLRTAQEITLRGFADMVKLSPTFISMLERGEFQPPSETKIREIARALKQDEGAFVALAGRVAADWQEVMREHPQAVADFFRTAKNLTKEDLANLAKQAEQLSKKRSEEEEN